MMDLSFLKEERLGVPCECFRLKPTPWKTTKWGWGRGEEKKERKETLSKAVSFEQATLLHHRIH